MIITKIIVIVLITYTIILLLLFIIKTIIIETRVMKSDTRYSRTRISVFGEFVMDLHIADIMNCSQYIDKNICFSLVFKVDSLLHSLKHCGSVFQIVGPLYISDCLKVVKLCRGTFKVWLFRVE